MLRKICTVVCILAGIHFIWTGYRLFTVSPDGDGVGVTLLLLFEYLVHNNHLNTAGLSFTIIGSALLLGSTFYYFRSQIKAV